MSMSITMTLTQSVIDY